MNVCEGVKVCGYGVGLASKPFRRQEPFVFHADAAMAPRRRLWLTRPNRYHMRAIGLNPVATTPLCAASAHAASAHAALAHAALTCAQAGRGRR